MNGTARAASESDETDRGAGAISACADRASVRPGTGERSPAWFRGLSWTALALSGLFAATMAWAPTRSWTYSLLTDESGPVELGTFLGFLLAAVLAARAARSRPRSAAPKGALAWWGFAALTALAALEEISWGQHLLGFPTPGWLYDVNAQGEANLHNLDPLMNLSSACVLAVALAGIAWAVRGRVPSAAGFRVPRALVPLLGVIALMGALETANDLALLGTPPSQVVGTISELAELWLSIACLLAAAHGRAERAR